MNLTKKKYPATTDVQVMCINRDILTQAGVPSTGAGVYEAPLAAILDQTSTDDPSDILYLSRNIVDTKLSGTKISELSATIGIQFPQLLGYIQVKCGGKYLSYAREVSGEARLLNSRSIGFGGHSEPEDITTVTHGDGDEYFSPIHSFMLTASRELEEELGLPRSDFYDGLDNDRTLKHIIVDARPNEKDPTKLAVGEVHVGIVITVDIASEDLVKETTEAKQLKWLTLEELKADFDMYESWSQLLIEHFTATNG